MIDVCLLVQVSALQEVGAAEAEGFLVKEARKWASKAAKDYKIVTHGERVRLTDVRQLFCVFFPVFRPY